MNNALNFPFIIFVSIFITMWCAARLGDSLRNRSMPLEEVGLKDLNIVLGATLTLLGLIIGFSFSMAVARYDLRKSYEEAEANAIGTEYIRSDLLPAADAAKVRELLKLYLDQRVLFYTIGNVQQRAQINVRTVQLQSEMWSAAKSGAVANPTAVLALAVAGMNDVLNSEGFTQAAWWNRIPPTAWALMSLISIGCSFLIGYSAHRTWKTVLTVLPLAVSISFFLIADIDSPTGGSVRVLPENLIRLSQTINAE